MKKFISCVTFIFSAFTVFAFQDTDSSYIESEIILHTSTGDILGTLTTPKKNSRTPVALIIAGSGPTDRNGNNSMMKNNSLMQLAQRLAENDIASVRFDKRGIAASEAAGKKEADLRFENYIDDASGWIALLKKDKRFSKIIVIGHSEGSLIGMIAGRAADKYVSIAGAGQAADAILKLQLAEQTQEIKDLCFPIIDSLKAGKTVADVNPMLYSLFRPSVQPYMISWFKYDPQEEITKLKIPILVLQGTNDIQVKEEDARRLAKANPAAKLLLIENMNHVFKIVAGDKDSNIKAYNDPALPVSALMIHSIIDFVKE
jgi:pimeloyl-ACP methyl ester carboxylesterase